MPESGSEVQGWENGGVGSTDVADAFGDLLHGVLVDVGVLIEFPEILLQTKGVTVGFTSADFSFTNGNSPTTISLATSLYLNANDQVHLFKNDLVGNAVVSGVYNIHFTGWLVKEGLEP